MHFVIRTLCFIYKHKTQFVVLLTSYKFTDTMHKRIYCLYNIINVSVTHNKFKEQT